MEKYENLSDEAVNKIVASELKKFNDLIKGHEKLLEAIGSL
jgi:hypothetical protein